MTPFIAPLSYSIKREFMIHLRNPDYKQCNLHYSRKPHFNFRIYKTFLTSSAFKILFSPSLCLLLRLSWILNIPNVLFSSNLNRFNTLGLYQKPVPVSNSKAVQHHSIIDWSSFFKRRGVFNTWDTQHVIYI